MRQGADSLPDVAMDGVRSRVRRCARSCAT